MESQEFKIVAKTFQGLEEVLAKEITDLGGNNVETGIRMVSFAGDQSMLYRANFCLRTAVRVLKPICEFKANTADEVYEAVKKIDWAQYMDCSNTFLIDSVVYSEIFRHSKFVAYRVKDAIADHFREKVGERPSVGITNPDIRINVHIAEDKVTISLDSSGESLHQRGYRTGTVAAPLNEVLAAGMIKLTGWDGECDLVDPMCGSGTILIEAALIALNIYPGVFRKEFAFEKWKDFDKDLFDSIYNDDSQEREFNHKIYGYDINRQAVTIAQDNARSAGVGKVVQIEQKDLYDFEKPEEKALMVTNPPYGERITTDDLLGLYEKIGEKLKHNFIGNDAWVLSYRDECFAKIGLRPSTRYALYNGALECEFRKYQVFDGKLSDRRSEGLDIKTDEERERNMHFKPHRHADSDDTEKGERKPFRSFDKDERRGDRKPFGGSDRGERRGDGERRRSESKPYASRSKFDDLWDDTERRRRSFKWGDRTAERDDRRDGDRRQRSFDRDRRSDDRGSFRRDDRPYDRDKKRSFGRDDRKPRDFRRNHEESRQRNDRREKDDRRNRKWGFDSEGRPFRRGGEDNED